MTGPSSTPRGERHGTPGAHWETVLTSTEVLVPDALRLAAQIPTSRLHVIAGGGHRLPTQHPEAFLSDWSEPAPKRCRPPAAGTAGSAAESARPRRSRRPQSVRQTREPAEHHQGRGNRSPQDQGQDEHVNDDAGTAGRPERSQIPAFLRRLDPPRTADGRPDYRPPAAALAACTAIVFMFVAFYMALYSKLWHHHQHLAMAAVFAGTALPVLAVYVAAHRLLARTGLYLWQSVLAGTILLTVMGSAHDWAQAIFPRADDRYETELGGPGRCLHATPYNLDRAQTTSDDHQGRMVVDPIADGLPALRLDNAVDGGLKHLSPADPTARKILARYGC